jgi:hypothetical protein
MSQLSAGHGREIHAAGRARWRKRMILELVEFNSPKGWTRAQVAEDARHVIDEWKSNPDLLRKHFLLSSTVGPAAASTSGRR